MSWYRQDQSGETWWCNSHNRRAAWLHERDDGSEEHVCDPNLGGILLPCRAVNLTGIAEIEDERDGHL